MVLIKHCVSGYTCEIAQPQKFLFSHFSTFLLKNTQSSQSCALASRGRTAECFRSAAFKAPNNCKINRLLFFQLLEKLEKPAFAFQRSLSPLRKVQTSNFGWTAMSNSTYALFCFVVVLFVNLRLRRHTVCQTSEASVSPCWLQFDVTRRSDLCSAQKAP